MRASLVLICLGAGLFIAAGGAALVFWSDSARLATQLRQSDELFRKLQQEAGRLETEKSQLTKEYEALQSDVVSYVSVNTKLQDEAEGLKEQLADAHAQLQEKTTDLERLQGKLEKLHKEMSRASTERRRAVTKEIKDLNAKVAQMEQTLKHERSLYQYNLGIVYAQANRYDDAIEAYRKSIELSPRNADAHYNLGLLYDRVKTQSDRAAWHYRRYLELKPQAEDREEVQQWIDMLTASVR